MRGTGHAARPALCALAVSGALLGALPSGEANAAAIGDIDVRSVLGERFYASIPVQTDGGAPIDPNCVRVGPHPDASAGAASLSAPRIRTNPSGRYESVVVETLAGVDEPIVGLRLQVGCTNPLARDFLVLLETPAQRAAAAAPPPPPSRPVARPGAAETGARAARRPAGTAPAGAAADRGRAAAAPPAKPAPPPQAAVQAPPAPFPAPGGPRLLVHLDEEAGGAKPGVSPEIGEQLGRAVALRARADDQAAQMLEIQDRLKNVQVEADRLKAMLEQALAQPGAAPAAQPASGPAPAQPAVVIETRTTRSSAIPLWWAIGSGIAAFLAGIGLGLLAGRGRRPARQAAPSGGRAAAVAATPAIASRPLRSGVDRHDDREPTMPVAGAMRGAAGESDAFASTLVLDASRPPRRVTPDEIGTMPPELDEAPPTLDGPMAIPFGETLPGAADTLAGRHATNPGAGSALFDPEAVVRQARIHYMDDGDPFKAIDLLEMAAARQPGEARIWHALFSIYRREEMSDRYERTARAYFGKFREDEHWAAIQYVGREIDAGNPLYAPGDAVSDGTPPRYDDILERWLGVPLDFTAHLLANELHDKLIDDWQTRTTSFDSKDPR